MIEKNSYKLSICKKFGKGNFSELIIVKKRVNILSYFLNY